MSSNEMPLALREKIGVVLFVVFGPIFAESSWQYAPKIEALQNFTPFELALIGALGGAVAGFLFGKTRLTRFIGAGAGALGAFGCNYAFSLVYGSAARAGSERFLVFLGGALPGLLIGVALISLVEKSGRLKAAAVPPSGP